MLTNSLEWFEPPELLTAHRLWNQDNFAAACQAFAAVVRQHPRCALALADAGRAFGATYQFAQAELFLARLKKLAQSDGPGLVLAGKAYRFIRKMDAALLCFEKALHTGKAISEAHLQIAQILERRNQVAQAKLHLAATLREVADSPEAWLLGARIFRREEDPLRAKALLMALVAGDVGSAKNILLAGILGEALASVPGVQAALSAELRSAAYLELANIHDRLGEYPLAWQAMLQGKSLHQAQAQSAQEHRDRLLPGLTRITREFTSHHWNQWRQEAQPSPGNHSVHLLTGLPRSGNTLLEKLVEGHPQVHGCDEFDLFARLVFPALLAGKPLNAASLQSISNLDSQLLAQQRGLYAEALATAAGAAQTTPVLIDKNPSYLPLLVPYLRMSPTAQVVVCLRDPRDILVSCLFSHFPLNDFGVDCLQPDRAAARIAHDLSLYFHVLAAAPEAVHAVRYEDLVQDPDGIGPPLMESLGLPWDPQQLQFPHRTAKSDVFAPSYEQVTKPIHQRSLGRWQNYEGELAPFLPLLRETLRQLQYA